MCFGGGVSQALATTTEDIIDAPIAAPCGEIIIPANFRYEDQEEERTTIEDCDNPFNADETVSYELSAKLNGQTLAAGDTVILPTYVNQLQLSYSITYAEAAINSEMVDLYRRVGDDYYIEAQGYNEQGSLSINTPGDYILVVSSQEFFLNQRNESLLQRWFSKLVPTAHAYYEDYKEVYTLSFTVEAAPPPPPAGASSVLFLPGIQGSRLYAGTAISNPGWDNDIEKDELLWEPGNNDDVRALAMTDTGVSIHDVYTKDVLDEIYGVSNIYRGFLDFLERLKQADTMPIREYEAFAYDWRYSVQDIVVSGARRRQEIKSLVTSIENLAADSYTGKVTIVAHSNGGLLAKALITELERLGEADLVDTLIFIGTPHLGTPKALGTVLHGYDQQQVGGLIVDDEVAREVINNLPGAYALLPSEEYLSQSTLPIITFREGATTAALRGAFGETIDSVEEYVNFLNGTEGRTPTRDDISTPYTTNPGLLSRVLQSHQAQLDRWQPPAHLAVYNIVGVGLPTVRQLEYRDVVESVCLPAGNAPACSSKSYLRPFVQFTQYGVRLLPVCRQKKW